MAIAYSFILMIVFKISFKFTLNISTALDVLLKRPSTPLGV